VNLLLDTHVLIWWREGSNRLGPKARAALLNTTSTPTLSAVSVWEMSIKTALRRMELSVPLDEWFPQFVSEGRCRELAITVTHVLAVGALPPHHADPFDRMLIAQAKCEDLTLVTADPQVMSYDLRTLDATK
jgi:PIN domain nuclease of toxin-antitoxin system